MVFLGNFGPEGPETMLADKFGGPTMVVAAAEETGDNLIDGRGDAYCGMLNCSYNLGLRRLSAHIPEYPVGTADEVANVAELLMSNRGAFITGSDFLVDGGATAAYFYGSNLE